MTEKQKKAVRSKQCPICDRIGDFQCSACDAVSYCSSKHQKEDWKVHKQLCKQINKMRQAAKEIEASGLGWSLKQLSFNINKQNRLLKLAKKLSLHSSDQVGDSSQRTSNLCLDQHAAVFYTCTYPNRLLVSEHPKRGEVPQQLKVSASCLLPGIVLCLLQMTTGEEATFLVHPDLLYRTNTEWMAEMTAQGIGTNIPLLFSISVAFRK